MAAPNEFKKQKCDATGKTRFGCKEDAQKARKCMPPRSKRRKTGCQPIREYKCDNCNGWHLTSKKGYTPSSLEAAPLKLKNKFLKFIKK